MALRIKGTQRVIPFADRPIIASNGSLPASGCETSANRLAIAEIAVFAGNIIFNSGHKRLMSHVAYPSVFLLLPLVLLLVLGAGEKLTLTS